MTPAFGTLLICEDAVDLASRGADYLCDLATRNPARMLVAHSGGNTPKPCYALPAQKPLLSKMRRDRIQFILDFVSGEDKREILDKMLLGDTDVPAAHIRPEGEVIWFADRAAAVRWA